MASSMTRVVLHRWHFQSMCYPHPAHHCRSMGTSASACGCAGVLHAMFMWSLPTPLVLCCLANIQIRQTSNNFLSKVLLSCTLYLVTTFLLMGCFLYFGDDGRHLVKPSTHCTSKT